MKQSLAEMRLTRVRSSVLGISSSLLTKVPYFPISQSKARFKEEMVPRYWTFSYRPSVRPDFANELQEVQNFFGQ